MSVLDLAYPRTYPDDKPHHTFIPPTSRPTIILVHGGWQGPETFSLIVPGLEKAGYSVFAVTLPSASVVPAVPNFSSDVAVIRNAVTSTLAIGKDVVLVMHSFGAVVGCEAMKEVKVDEASIEMETEGALRIGRVVRLAFIAGLLFPEGKATREESRGEDAIPGFHCQDNLIRMLDGPTRFYNDLPPHAALRWAARLKKHSRFAFASPLTYAAYRDFPSSYLMCTEDQAVPYPIQKRFVAMARIHDVTTITSGHSPMVSQPKSVEVFIRKCAGEEVPKL
ncbi:MAG: hypothetical protein Q9211_004996 [Gyalolechia sp. 1 TL-2023]